jgi:myo-inositol-1(or 4)-monophosphatase
VSIALVDEEGPAVGVVNAPFLGEVFQATRGGGAYRNGSRIETSRVELPRDALVATGFPFKEGKGDPAIYFELVREVMLQAQDIRRAGSAALDLAYVACGRLEGYFEIGLSPWDIAAGILFVTESGGTVTGWPGDVDSPLATGRILASNGLIHDWLWSTTGRFVPAL